MLDWLVENDDLLNIIVSMCMLIVWIVYLQIFYLIYMRQRRPKIIISRATGEDLHSHCLLSNMSAEPIYVCNIIVHLTTDDDEWYGSVTDIEASSDDSDMKATELTYQGPLTSGDFFDLGSFKKIICNAAKMSKINDEDFTLEQGFDVEVIIIAIYSSENKFIGANRKFQSNDGKIKPTSIETNQFYGFRARKKVMAHLSSDTTQLV